MPMGPVQRRVGAGPTLIVQTMCRSRIASAGAADLRQRPREPLHAIANLPLIAYYTSDSVERLRVHDCAFGPPLSRPHHRRVVPLEDHPRANHRYFVPEFGVARVYGFTKSESRELTSERLALQLRGAGFVATSGANVSAVRPT